MRHSKTNELLADDQVKENRSANPSTLSGGGDGSLRMPVLSGKRSSSHNSSKTGLGNVRAESSASASLERELGPGRSVHVHGLVTASQFNGHSGTCEKFDAASGRWNVRFVSGDVKALKPENLLAAGLPVLIHSLRGAPELNDQEVLCETFDATRSRWRVRFRNGEVKLVKPDNLQRPLS